MNSNRKWIWFLATLAAAAVIVYFAGGALWSFFLRMHGH